VKVYILLAGVEYISTHKTWESARCADFFEGMYIPVERWRKICYGEWLETSDNTYHIREVSVEE